MFRYFLVLDGGGGGGGRMTFILQLYNRKHKHTIYSAMEDCVGETSDTRTIHGTAMLQVDSVWHRVYNKRYNV